MFSQLNSLSTKQRKLQKGKKNLGPHPEVHKSCRAKNSEHQGSHKVKISSLVTHFLLKAMRTSLQTLLEEEEGLQWSFV